MATNYNGNLLTVIPNLVVTVDTDADLQALDTTILRAGQQVMSLQSGAYSFFIGNALEPNANDIFPTDGRGFFRRLVDQGTVWMYMDNNAVISQLNTSNDPVNINLPNDQILIGGVDGFAHAQTMSGDVTISNSGVATIANLAVTAAKIANSTITQAKMVVQPFAAIKSTGRYTANAGTTFAIPATGAVAGDKALVIREAGTNACYPIITLADTDVINLTINTDCGSDTIFSWILFRDISVW